MNVAYNRDCMEAMREFPDKFFDLAVVDPPYGDGLHAENGGGKGRFTKYNQAVNSQSVHVERERESGTRGTDSDNALISTSRPRHQTFGLRKTDRNYEAKKEAAKQEAKKS